MLNIDPQRATSARSSLSVLGPSDENDQKFHARFMRGSFAQGAEQVGGAYRPGDQTILSPSTAYVARAGLANMAKRVQL